MLIPRKAFSTAKTGAKTMPASIGTTLLSTRTWTGVPSIMVVVPLRRRPRLRLRLGRQLQLQLQLQLQQLPRRLRPLPTPRPRPLPHLPQIKHQPLAAPTPAATVTPAPTAALESVVSPTTLAREISTYGQATVNCHGVTIGATRLKASLLDSNTSPLFGAWPPFIPATGTRPSKPQPPVLGPAISCHSTNLTIRARPTWTLVPPSRASTSI